VIKNKRDILMCEEEITMRWKEYLEDLYGGNGEITEHYIVIEEMYRIKEDEMEPRILKNEFIKAIHDMKSNKTAGINTSQIVERYRRGH